MPSKKHANTANAANANAKTDKHTKEAVRKEVEPSAGENKGKGKK